RPPQAPGAPSSGAHRGHRSSLPPAEENRRLPALGNEHSDVGRIVLHTGVGEIPWPALPVTTQINGIRGPSLPRQRLLPEPPDSGGIRRAMDEEKGRMVRHKVRGHGRYSKHSAGLLEWMMYGAHDSRGVMTFSVKAQGHDLLLTSVTGQVL